MESLSKIVSRQDAQFKLSPSTSNETSINLPTDISELIGLKSSDVTFKIYKEDFVKALGVIGLLKPLYNKKETEPTDVSSTFDWLSNQIVVQFGNQEQVNYTVEHLVREDGRFYLKGLKLNNGFCIRSFLIEQFSTLVFTRNDDSTLTLRIVTSMPKDFNIDTSVADVPKSIGLLRNEPLQVIYYGAPGTGKSHKIKQFLEENNVPNENVFRTTFHPDSDYSSFVGSYKPSKGLRKMYGLNGGTTVAMELGGNHLEEEVITYQFIPQAFLLAYIQAYKKPEENVFLVIEEINRGNCAQIFGDLFQLLDRDENGKSDYTIKADTDLKKFLIDELGKDNEGIAGGELCLPSNFYIFATMNTSDQSLFPIDSAFKRRWDWEYEPIKYKNTDWLIEIDNIRYSWVEFQKEVNNRILKDTGSEDKMMGDYFVKPHDKIISKKLFLNKVLFYLWTDVCKDGDCDIFPTENDFSFSKLYDENSSQTIHSLMENLGVNPVSDTATDDSTESDKSDGEDDSSKKLPKYTINGNPERLTTPKAVVKVIENYAKQHEDASVDEMINLWNDISGRKNCLVADWMPSENDNQPFANKRRSEIKWGDNKSVWVINGWTEELFKIFTHNAKEKLGISIEKVE